MIAISHLHQQEAKEQVGTGLEANLNQTLTVLTLFLRIIEVRNLMKMTQILMMNRLMSLDYFIFI